MRLVQVAKALGMTGQQLRKELENVDFGIKPTDREIPDNLAQGVIRFVARKNGITVDMESLPFGDELAEEKKPSLQLEEDEDEEMAEEESPDEKKEAAPADTLHVLRKLTLDDVKPAAIKKQQAELELSREERKERQREEQEDSLIRRKPKAGATTAQEQIKKKTGTIQLPSQISVKEFAEKAGVQVPQVISALMKNGVLATITQSIDYDTAAIVAADLNLEVVKEEGIAKAEHIYERNLEELLKDEKENLQPRPPIVVVMGHVDHGKTSILDAIRQSDVVAKESGGITQHIGAYQIEHDGRPITFLDTPGHEAFTAMRARGAQLTDIAILVVSAEEGVKATTIEAINHAKEAGIPIIVAVNKMDRPNADPERVKGELAGHGLQAEDWGGDVPFVPTSAVTKQGISDLLDHVLLIADVHEFSANPGRSSVATVIESHLDQSLGPLATVVVNTGTLKVTDAFICGHTMGKVRSMTDAHGVRLQSAGPSGAVRIAGFASVPHVGDILQSVSSDKVAKELLKEVLDHAAMEQKGGMGDLVSMLHEGKLTQLKVVLKADTQGSLEAIRASLDKQTTDEVQVKVIHGAIGAVSESDVMMAAASNALLISFHCLVPNVVQRTAQREGVNIRQYDVIYNLLEDIQGLLLGLLVPEEEEKITGHLEVKGIFLTKKNEQIIGGRVTDGIVKRYTFRLQRGGEVVGQGRILSLKRVDNDIKEAKADSECGMRVECSTPVEEGDVLEVYYREFKKKDEI